MESAKSAGRTIGALLLLQAAAGALVNFVLLRPAMAPPGFLVNAASNSTHLSMAVLIGLAAGACSIGIAIAAWPTLHRRSQAVALWLFALAGAGFVLNAVENTMLLSMLSLSQAHANASANPPDAGQLAALVAVVRSARSWAHYIHLIVASGMFVLFHGVLLRFRLIPRALAGFAVLAALLQLAAVTMPLFGQRAMLSLLAPAGLSHLLMASWLIIKGFGDRASCALSGQPQTGART